MDYLNIGKATLLLQKYKENLITHATGSNVELECRIGRFDNGFISDIGIVAFGRLRDYILQGPHTNTMSEDTISLGVRKTESEGNITYLKKTNITYVDDQGLGTRLSLSIEQEVPATEFSDTTDALVRTKNRYSKVIGNVRIDLTRVSTRRGVSHELELEFLGGDVMELNTVFEKIFKLVYDSDYIYTSLQSSSLIEYINRAMLDFNDEETRKLFPESEVNKTISYYPYPRLRNLKMEDLKHGALVGGQVTYSVTYKTDGIHKFLIIAKSGIWFFNPPNSLSLIQPFSNELLGLIGLILEGELVPVDKRRLDQDKNYKHLFYIYDCLALPLNTTVDSAPDIGVQSLGLNVRMSCAASFVEVIRSEQLITNVELRLKDYMSLEKGIELDMYSGNNHPRPYSSPNEFFQIINYMLNNEAAQVYETDGLVFTPNNTVYNTHSNSVPLEQRVLSKHPDIVKWKPLEKLTIDFYVIDMGEYYELYTYNSFNRQLELFDKYSKVSKKDLPSIISGSIVEIGFTEDLKPVFHKIREDKSLPNNTDIARAVFKDILNPITEETVAGKGFKLMRHYHNKIKKQLFDYALDKINGPKVLLDLGSGKGGDIGKWKEFDRIIAVEPNSEYIQEMKQRLITYHMEDRVTIIQVRAQDTDIIATELRRLGIDKVSCISCMLAMTFLWESSQTLNSFVNTLKSFLIDGGMFVYFVMDGDLVEQLFRPAFLTSDMGNTTIGHDYNLKDIDFNGAKLKLLGSNKVHVHINESIVTDQEEYLVHLDDLALRLEWQEGRRERADKEQFLPLNEKGFSSLFTYGSFTKVPTIMKEDNLLPIVSRVPILNYATDRAEGDNVPYFINCSWYTNLLAYTTIGDGSCFFHAVAKLIEPSYFSIESLAQKVEITTKFRKELADALYKIDPKTGKEYYLSTVLPEFARTNPLYSLSSVYKKLSDPKEFGEDFMYSLIPLFMGVDLVVLEYRNGDLVPNADTIGTIDRPIICLVNYDAHFEALTEYDPVSNTSIPSFTRQSPFIQAYLKRKSKNH
jgi:hypothetical protein